MSFEAIEAALARGDMHGAARHAEAMLAAGRRDAYLLNIAAWACEDRGDYSAALRLLEDAQALAPGDPLVTLSVGAVMRKLGRLSDAFAAFARAAPLLADNPAFWLERGYAHEAANRFAAAADDFARAVRLDPASAVCVAALAAMEVRLGEHDAARTHALRALSSDPRNSTALIAHARCDLADGQAEAARDTMAALVARDDVPLADLVLGFALLGDAHDRLGAAPQAYAAYRDANAHFQRQHAGLLGPTDGAIGQTAFIERIGAEFDAIPAVLWQRPTTPSQSPAEGHCFLLGYPRSGTTLVETILASAASVETLEERPTLASAAQQFLEPSGALARLTACESADLDPYVRAYWAQVRHFGIEPAGTFFVDMDPLKGMMLPLIARLFPRARIVLMRRDPRDIVWSCFRTSFAPTAAAWEFTTLIGTARHYDALMRLTERCLERLPLAVQELRYEALVSDFEATTRALCAFLDLEWTADLQRFDRTAARRSVTTASASQVRRGLYDGSKQWEAYAEPLAEVEDILAPWVARFGYS